jgi:uncharacterized DUF497 family protein
MRVTITWDSRKAKQNLRRHRVAFEEAATVFTDPLSSTIEDPLHSEEEDRFVIIGESIRRRILVVVHTDEGDTIRIISARVATAFERKQYEESNEN